jgi:hypothetical protein
VQFFVIKHWFQFVFIRTTGLNYKALALLFIFIDLGVSPS